MSDREEPIVDALEQEERSTSTGYIKSVMRIDTDEGADRGSDSTYVLPESHAVGPSVNAFQRSSDVENDVEEKEEEEEEEMVAITASKRSNERPTSNGKSSRSNAKARTKEIALTQSNSNSDISPIVNDVSFRFRVLKPRIVSPNGLRTMAASVARELGIGKDGTRVPPRSSKRYDRSKTLLELNYEHVNKFYSEGFDIDKNELNKTASGRTTNDVDGIPVSFARAMRFRLHRMYIVAGIGVNTNDEYEFDVHVGTPCSECDKMQALRQGYDDYDRCDRCTEADALKLMNAVEFFVLACKHQRAGTLQVLAPSTSVTATSATTRRDDNRSSATPSLSISSGEESSSDGETFSNEEGDVIIPIPAKSDSSTTTKQQQRLRSDRLRQQRLAKEEEERKQDEEEGVVTKCTQQ